MLEFSSSEVKFSSRDLTRPVYEARVLLRGEFTVLRTTAAQGLVCMLVMMQCIVIRRGKLSPNFKKDFGGSYGASRRLG